MKNYAPDKMELAPRDLVSRSEQKEIDQGAAANSDGQAIYLDLRHLDARRSWNGCPRCVILALPKICSAWILSTSFVPSSPPRTTVWGGIPTNNDGQAISDAQVPW